MKKASSPEHHHVQGVVGEAGDERGQRDDEYDGQEEVRAAVGAGSRPGVTLAPGHTPAAGVELQPDGKHCCYLHRGTGFYICQVAKHLLRLTLRETQLD